MDGGWGSGGCDKKVKLSKHYVGKFRQAASPSGGAEP